MLTLLVEDDVDYAEIISHTLKREQHEVIVLDSIAGATSFVGKKKPDLLIVDVTLPDGSGLQLCQAVRGAHRGIPIMVLSAAERLADVLAGFRAGADDYVVKPFHPAELLARVNALLRRIRATAPRPSAGGQQRVQCNGLDVDVENQTAYLNGISLNCTPIEVEILAQLARYPGQALSHAFLTEQVWGYTNVKDASLLKGHVSSIRRKVKLVGGDEEMVRTVHGVGYSCTPV